MVRIVLEGNDMTELSAMPALPNEQRPAILDSPRIVVVIPAFNEEKNIAKVVVQARRYADKVIVCDDGSTDLTADIAIGLGAEVIRHEKNLGYGTAIRSLFKRAREFGADVTVTLDGDGQHDPREIPNLIQPVLKGKADVVIGSRFLGEGQSESIPKLRRIGIEFITKLTSAASDRRLSDAQSGFRAYSNKALNGLTLSEEGMGVSVEVLMETKKRKLTVVEVPSVCNYEGSDRTSTQNPVRHGTGVVISLLRLVVEDRPVLLMGLPGIVLLMIGVAFGAWMLQIYASEGHIVTNIAIAATAFVLIGLFAIFASITLYSIGRLAQKYGAS